MSLPKRTGIALQHAIAARRRGTRERLAGTLGLAVVVACGPREAGPRARGAEFERLFESVREVVIEEPDSAPIGQLRALRPLPGGGFVIVDMMNAQLRLHDRDGALVRLVGRAGGGPGEFQAPIDAAVGPRGEVYVIESGANRVQRLRPDLEPDSVLQWTAPGSGMHVALFQGSLVLGLREMRDGTFGVLRPGGELAAFHHWDPAIAETPYWLSIAVDHLAAGPRGLVVANSLVYPLRYYESTTAPGRPFGRPPPSWSAASRPKAGEFTGGVGAGRRKLADYLNTFTVVAGVHILEDSLILVSHGRYRAEPTMPLPELFRIHPYAFDLYDLAGRKLAEDVPLRGTIVAADSLLYVVEGEPPAPRRLVAYRLRRRARPAPERSPSSSSPMLTPPSPAATGSSPERAPATSAPRSPGDPAP